MYEKFEGRVNPAGFNGTLLCLSSVLSFQLSASTYATFDLSLPNIPTFDLSQTCSAYPNIISCAHELWAYRRRKPRLSGLDLLLTCYPRPKAALAFDLSSTSWHCRPNIWLLRHRPIILLLAFVISLTALNLGLSQHLGFSQRSQTLGLSQLIQAVVVQLTPSTDLSQRSAFGLSPACSN
ncbi:hypothetical protein AVEN_4466-1 [Araneus ventricosus]|uniref:Uncharacterized protein n=1 Tax=Araneus ventricosus TaxID=182803 RepID=A0A4Y2HNF5_ARAVE|nr:hypothetical protein AVEN_4466-1 [Araneus ventricosus]